MIAMDFKGVTWVGNVYQKFEAMCLEVEEIIVQDTVKYVENQVQTVGASVKKFYSDVVQDLLPPSPADPVKVTAGSELSGEQCTAVYDAKKTKEGITEEAVKVDHEKVTKDSKVITYINKSASPAPNIHGLHARDSTAQSSFQVSGKEAYSEYSREHDRQKISKKSNLGVKRISKRSNLPTALTYGDITHLENLSNAPTSRNLSEKDHEFSYYLKTATATPVFPEVSRCDSAKESCNEIENASNFKHHVSTDTSSDMNALVESIAIKELEIRHSCSGSSSADSNAAGIYMQYSVVSQAGSSMNLDVLHDEFLGQSGWSGDAIKINIEQGRETIQCLNKVQLEQSCVIVDRDEFHFVPHKERNLKPYKKKIRDAISSSMRSARKQEYEQLATQWDGDDAKSKEEYLGRSKPILSMANTERSPTHEICDSEWELL